MILTHEQAHTAYKIMLLALEGGASATRTHFGQQGVAMATAGMVSVVCANSPLSPERFPSLADFATAYDVAGTAQRIEYAKAAQSWGAFCNYHGARVPCMRDQFERLSVAGRVTKMVLGLWA